MDWKRLATLRPARAFGFSNGGWNLDAYPDLEPLDAGKRMTVAALEGPGVVTCIHCTQHAIWAPGIPPEGLKELVARGIVFEVYYDGADTPSVCVPLADFFADGSAGHARLFTTPFVEKAPHSYNCFIPMPFERSVRVVLRNDTPYNFANYSYVECERLPAWDGHLGYLHATWKRFPFQLTRDSNERFFYVEGEGHLLGRNWSIATDEPMFQDFHFVMEGNNEVRIDGEATPSIDYLGSEDSFGFAWGWPEPHTGLHNGINFVQHKDPALLSVYRFRDNNVIPFEKSLEWRVNWNFEFQGNTEFHNALAARKAADGAWVDYAVTHYWYQGDPGYAHEPMPPLDERVKAVLRTNSLA